MANNQIVISRIQNRRGIRENLPQPLLPGEFALTVDTGELWIGTDPNQPPYGVRTYGSGAGDISSAESIVDTQIASVLFSTIDETGFNQLVDYLRGTPTPAVDLEPEDILWDGRLSVFIAANTSVDPLNTISNVMTAVSNSPVGGGVVAQAYDALGALNDPSVDPSTTFAFDVVDGDFLFTIAGSNAEQGANAATLINRIHGTQLVTTLANLQVTTTGVGVGTPTFLNWVVYDNEANLPVAPTWLNASTPRTVSADSVTDTMRVVAGEGISLDADVNEDYIRITNTYSEIPTNEFTLLANQAAFVDVTNLNFDIDAVSDVIFLDYSLNIGAGAPSASNYTAGGQMIVVGDNNVGSGSTTLTDNQVEVRDQVGDPLFSQVQFLAGFEGPDGSQSYTEESQNALAATFSGTQLRTNTFNSGASSLANDSGSDQTTFPNDAALQLGSGDFCIETFVRANTVPTSGRRLMLGHWGASGGNRPWSIFMNGPHDFEIGFNSAFTLVRPVNNSVESDAISFDFSGDTITRTGGTDFVTAGFTLSSSIQITNAANPANNGTYIIASVGANTIQLTTSPFVADTGDTSAVIGTPIANNIWHHIVLERTGNDWYLGFNGYREHIDIGSLVGAMETSDAVFTFGGSFTAGAIQFWNGRFDDTRITIGSNRYDLASNATYTIPTTPFATALTPLSGDVNFQATYVPGSPNQIQIQYTNTFTSNVNMRVVRKRWLSY